MAVEFKLPNLGENIESGGVLSILVSEGDQVEAEQGVLEIETDKATLEVPCPTGGRITKIHVSEGDTIPIGTLLLTLEPARDEPHPTAPTVESASRPPASRPEPTTPVAKSPSEPQVHLPASDQQKAKMQQADHDPGTRVAPSMPVPDSAAEHIGEDVPGDGRSSTAAGPAVRRLARELGVDLKRVQPKSPGRRITREDVQAYVRQTNERAAALSSGSKEPAVTPPGKPDADAYGAIRREKMSRMRQTIAKNMVESYTTIPQLTNFDDADVTELEKTRQESKADYAQSGIKLTAMPFLIKAVASALKRHPVINASLDEDNKQIVYKEYINIGIAVDTDRGLVVPVMRDVDQLNIPQIARGLMTLAENARKGDFSIEDLRGGTFTISNLGAVGGTYSTPIINPPEVAILLFGRSRTMPVFVEDHIEPRLMLPLSITYDHRTVDGAAAARFLNEVKGYLQAPSRLLLAP